MEKYESRINKIVIIIFLMTSSFFYAQVTLEKEIKISDFGLHFNGKDVPTSTQDNGQSDIYDFVFGRNISAHGDCIKAYGDYVFMTWYRGGKTVRNMMLTRYNIVTGTLVTIEFPHKHTGFQNQWWLGESHNTIAVGVSPLDGTIHLLYDMHAYSSTRPSNGSLANDYFRYSYSVKNAALLPDAEFTLDKFVNSTNNNYKHLRMPGTAVQSEFVALTYPNFFLNDSGDLFMYMREGGNNNGMYKFIKYNASTGNWGNFIDFNALNARNQSGITFNWGLYGDIKYVNGKMRIAFQRRSSNNNDKFEYQNGVYYAYSDDQSGATSWKNHKGQSFSLPLFDADFIKVMEPGDYVQGTNANSISIVGGFDWTVTDNGDEHIISRVRDNQFKVTKNLHTYRPSGASDFVTTDAFAGGEKLYTFDNKVYIIGLTSQGRVFVEKAEGGTSNFTRIYQATSGRVFDHGQVYIANGKLYYYLMEKKTGSAQPLYLQVIDLNITQEPFRVSLTSPTNDAVFKLGETVSIAANAVNENGSISKVEFKINDAFFGEDTTAPYSIDWAPTAPGDYTIQAIAYNSTNTSVTSSEVKVNFKISDPTDLTGDTYRIKNVATGKYLKSEGSKIVFSDTGVNEDTHWEFLKSPGNDSFYNIDSKVSGTIRFTGTGELISSSKNVANSDTDKTWTVIYHASDKNYTFQTRTSVRYLSHNSTGIGISSVINNESKWNVESTTASLSTENNLIDTNGNIQIYPNPAKDNFTINLNGFNSAEISIYSILGKLIYKETTDKKTISINNANKFKKGIFLVKIVTDTQKIFNKKLVIE